MECTRLKLLIGTPHAQFSLSGRISGRIPLSGASLASILTASAVLVEKRENLYLALGLPPSKLPDINTGLSLRGLGSDAFFQKTILIWISTNGPRATFAQLETTLRTESFIAVADALIERVLNFSNNDINNNNNESIGFDLPDRNTTFTGRSLVLEDLHATIMNQNREVTVITTVCGLGGIGKTTLSVEYAWKYYQLGLFKNVIWINSETLVTITDSFKRLATEEEVNIDTYDLHGKPVPLQVLVQKIYKRFSNESTLIIFDNAETYKEIKDYLPRPILGKTKPYVLLTSRNRNWAGSNVNIITLDVFTEDESVTFISSFLGLNTTREISYAKQISENMQNLPLGIKQASAHIKVSYKHIETMEDKLNAYLNDWEKNWEVALKFVHPADKYEKTVYVAWNVTLEKIRKSNKLATKIMQLVAYFNPDSIPIELFYRLLKKPAGCFGNLRFALFGVPFENIGDQVMTATELLNSYSLIDLNYSRQTFSVHRLVQKVIKLQNGIRDSRSRLRQATTLVLARLTLPTFERLDDICLIHAETIREHFDPQLQLAELTELSNIIWIKREGFLKWQIQKLVDLYYAQRYEAACKHFIEFDENGPIRQSIKENESNWYLVTYHRVSLDFLYEEIHKNKFMRKPLLISANPTRLVPLLLDEIILDVISLIGQSSHCQLKLELAKFVTRMFKEALRDRSTDRILVGIDNIIDVCVCLDSIGAAEEYLELIQWVNNFYTEEHFPGVNFGDDKLNTLVSRYSSLEVMLHTDFPVSNFEFEVLRVLARIVEILETSDLRFLDRKSSVGSGKMLRQSRHAKRARNAIEFVKLCNESEKCLIAFEQAITPGSAKDVVNNGLVDVSPHFIGKMVALVLKYGNVETGLTGEQIYLLHTILVCIEIILSVDLEA